MREAMKKEYDPRTGERKYKGLEQIAEEMEERSTYRDRERAHGDMDDLLVATISILGLGILKFAQEVDPSEEILHREKTRELLKRILAAYKRGVKWYS